MGISYDAYVAYGVRVGINPYSYNESGHDPGVQVDGALSVPTVKEACPDVGHLEAGAYDQNHIFLVTACESAGLGGYTRIGEGFEARNADWDRQITHLIEIMGWGNLVDEKPGWFVVSDAT